MSAYKEGAKYWGKLMAVQLGKANTGTPQMAFTFTILGEVNPADPQGPLLSCQQSERTVYRSLTEASIEFFWQDVDHLCSAMQLEDQPANPTDVPECGIVGAETGMYFKSETYNGKASEKWNISRGGGGAPEVKPLEETEAAKLNALFGRGKRTAAKPASRAPVGANPNANQAARSADAGKAGIPF